MGITAIIMLVLGIASVLASVGGAVGTNLTNKKLQEDTNEKNLQAVRETNAANVEQAELSYNRSLPMNQVRNLMQAGMSKAGALSALTGGGTYTAPVLQSAHAEAPKMDFAGIGSAMERLQGIPANVEQAGLIEDQRKALAVDTQNKINSENRAQQMHEFDMWQKTYGKNAAQMIDSLSSEIVSMAADKGISLDNIDTTDKLIKEFKLGSNKTWRTMPAMARNQVLDGVRTQAAENRAQQSQNNANIAAGDTHSIQTQHLTELKAQFEEWKNAKDLRAKQRKLEETETSIKQIMSDMNLTAAELRKHMSITKDKNGNPRVRPHKGIQGVAKEFWDTAGAIVGIDYLGEIIGRILLPLGK